MVKKTWSKPQLAELGIQSTKNGSHGEHICPHCGASFKNPGQLNKHEKNCGKPVYPVLPDGSEQVPNFS